MPCHTEHTCENCSYISFTNEFKSKSFAELGEMADSKIAELKRNIEKQKKIISGLRDELNANNLEISELKKDIETLNKYKK